MVFESVCFGVGCAVSMVVSAGIMMELEWPFVPLWWLPGTQYFLEGLLNLQEMFSFFLHQRPSLCKFAACKCI
jgi:hypothetical protein